MIKKKQESVAETSIADDMPPSNVRSVLSFLLFVHLFCVAMALAGIFAPSKLQVSLSQIVAPYNRFFGFDLNSQFYYAPYHLTGGIALDDDYLIEVEWRDAQGKLQTGRLTEDCFRGTCAHQRRQLLGKFISQMAAEENDNATSPLAETLGGGTIRAQDASTGTFRVRRHLSVDIEPSDDRQNPFEPDWYELTYEALIEITAEGKVLVIKRSEEGQVAPIE